MDVRRAMLKSTSCREALMAELREARCAQGCETASPNLLERRDRSINTTELKRSGELALMILRRALDAFARMDAVAAAQIVCDDEAVDNSFRAFERRLVMQVREAPPTIPVGLEHMFIAKAIERIGDHATNIAEFVVYVVKGRDVRHVSLDRLDKEVLAN
jgi:phosphate transport system protein